MLLQPTFSCIYMDVIVLLLHFFIKITEKIICRCDKTPGLCINIVKGVRECCFLP